MVSRLVVQLVVAAAAVAVVVAVLAVDLPVELLVVGSFVAASTDSAVELAAIAAECELFLPDLHWHTSIRLD